MVAPATSSWPGGLLYVLLQNSTGARMGTGDATPGVVVRLVPVDN
jgi:hypothetical protein